LNLRRWIILAGVALFSSAGDTVLSAGMKQVGEISLANLFTVFHAVANPYVIAGIVLLVAFFSCYLTALSWADLTYVLPATSIGYCLVAIFGKVFLHEQVTPLRWVGVLLIAAGVGFVAQSPHNTTQDRAASGEVNS
jgi:drug/metabolite transporter (DMT)-like permease